MWNGNCNLEETFSVFMRSTTIQKAVCKEICTTHMVMMEVRFHGISGAASGACGWNDLLPVLQVLRNLSQNPEN